MSIFPPEATAEEKSSEEPFAPPVRYHEEPRRITMTSAPPLVAQARKLPVTPASEASVQRVVVLGNGTPATVQDVREFIDEKASDVSLTNEEIESELEAEADLEEGIGIRAFLEKIGAMDNGMDVSDDADWDPADEAADPLDPDDILSSEVRKALGFNVTAKAWMKTDTPKDKSGNYVCHICGKAILKGQKVDMDHLPPWKERLEAFILAKGLTVDDSDELTGPLMKGLYNMRGSVFAHSSCNRGHSGEGNYKKKWGNAATWYKAGGGPPF